MATERVPFWGSVYAELGTRMSGMIRMTRTTSLVGLTLLSVTLTAGCSGSPPSGVGGSTATGGDSSVQGGTSSTGGTSIGTGGATGTGGTSCGVSGTPCCSSSAANACAAGLICQGASTTSIGVCQPCGTNARPCCAVGGPGPICQPGLLCIGSSCNSDFAATGGRAATGGATSTTGGRATGGRSAGTGG
jgi:hypothetical protein